MTWDKDEAYELIKDALAHLNECYLAHGKPDYDGTALDAAHDRIDEACAAEDMGELRKTVRAFVVAGLKELRQQRRTVRQRKRATVRSSRALDYSGLSRVASPASTAARTSSHRTSSERLKRFRDTPSYLSLTYSPLAQSSADCPGRSKPST